MKALLVCEYREEKFQEGSWELFGFADALGVETALVLVGSEDQIPAYDGKVYFGEVASCGEYNPDVHKKLVLQAIDEESPDYIVFLHSAYGWDLAPRIATAVKAAQVSEVISVVDGGFEVGCCNAKMRRTVKSTTVRTVITIQAGAFAARQPRGNPTVHKLATEVGAKVTFIGYEPAETKGVDLSKAEVIVTAGRGIGKKENIPLITALAASLRGELGASRPVVDAGWLDHSHQVGTTGQAVGPKLYLACGVSGAIQHVAGIKKSEFIVAINKDRDAPISETADVLVVADVLQFVPALTEKIKSL